MPKLKAEDKTPKADNKQIAPAKPKQDASSEIRPYDSSATWRDFDRIFGNFRRDFEDLLWPSRSILDRTYSLMQKWPMMDLTDRDSDFLLTVEVPGFKKEDIEILVEDRAIDIRASTGQKREEKTQQFLRRERTASSFHRRVDLPEEIIADKVEAKLNNGILELVLPKKAPKPKKRVVVK